MRNLIESPERQWVWNRNIYDQSPLKSQTRTKRDSDDETNDLTWRCCRIIPVRACQPGVGATRNH
jgi:hypothetical protein